MQHLCYKYCFLLTVKCSDFQPINIAYKQEKRNVLSIRTILLIYLLLFNLRKLYNNTSQICFACCMMIIFLKPREFIIMNSKINNVVLCNLYSRVTKKYYLV